MPFYTYRSKNEKDSCEYCQNSFETFQLIKEDALTTCPKCANQIVRIIYPSSSVKAEKSTSQLLSDDNLKKHGFKKLVNAGNGKFDVAV